MACLKEPAAEARRIAAVKLAIQQGHRPWVQGAFYGNVSPAGMRRRGQNSYQTGVDSLAFRLALRYAGAVLAALKGINRS